MRLIRDDRKSLILLVGLYVLDGMTKEIRLSRFGIIAGLCLLAGDLTAEVELPFYELEPIIVTAPRFDAFDVEVASRVQLIDRSTIESSRASNLVELLEDKANLHFRSTSGNTVQSEVSIGGFGENSGQRVLVLLNGYRLNSADLLAINWSSIPLALVESVEVIKGGQSALYGNNAAGGVIKITTLKPSEETSGSAQVSVGSFDSYNGRMAVTGKEGSLGFSAHAEHDESDGYRDNGQYEADGFGLSLNWAPDIWFYAHASVSAVFGEYGFPGSLTLADIQADRRQSNTPNDIVEDDSVYYRGGVGFFLGEELDLNFSGAYTRKDIFSDNPSFGSTLDRQYDTISFLPSLAYETDSFTALVGLDYIDEEVDGFSTFGPTPYFFGRETFAGFSSAKWNVSPDWILTGSFRVESATTFGVTQGVRSNDIDNNEVAWSLGLIRFFEKNRVYGSVRRFYRYPAADEIVQVFFTPVPVINLGLEPEWGHEVELGADRAFANLVVGGRLYHQWMRDEVFLNYATFSSFNEDKIRRTGVDLDARYAFSESLNLDFKYSWVSAKFDSGIDSGNEVPLVPEHKIRVVANYNLSLPVNLAFGATFTDKVYIGGDYSNTSETISEYVLFDLSVRYRYDENIEFFANADNLFDKEYLSSGFRGFFNDGYYPGVGRSGRIGARVSF